MKKSRLATEGLRSKSWDEFATIDAPEMDLVITVCDDVAGEDCPVWPGEPVTAHWSIEDPATARGDLEHRRQAFFRAYGLLQKRIELLLSLPLAKLDHLAIKHEVTAIGAR